MSYQLARSPVPGEPRRSLAMLRQQIARTSARNTRNGHLRIIPATPLARLPLRSRQVPVSCPQARKRGQPNRAGHPDCLGNRCGLGRVV